MTPRRPRARRSRVVQLRLIAARTASGRDTIRLVSKRRTPSVEPPEKRPPMSPAQIASAAYSLAILQAHEDTDGDVAARDAAVYEMLTLLCLESLAMLGRSRSGGVRVLAQRPRNLRQSAICRVHARRHGRSAAIAARARRDAAERALELRRYPP